MKNFDWQTDEADERLFEAAELNSGRKRRRISRKILLLLGGLLVLIPLAIYWQLERRAEAQTAVFEADVLAVFQVWQQAVAQQDDELFNTLLVGSDPAWAAGERRRFNSGFLMDRSQLDLALAAEEGRLQVAGVEIELSPDWTSAEVSFEQVYNVIDHPVDTLSTPRQIRLAYTLGFERNADRWFLAPPAEDFWGDRSSYESDYMIMTYPERDRETALRLAEDLAVDLAAICREQPREVCETREPIEVRLDTESNNMAFIQGAAPSLFGGQIFIIPTPSLVGRPVDEDGYDLLYRAYTTPVLNVFSSWVDTPLPLPDQELQVICYPPESRTPKLVRFVSPEEWVVDLPEQSFRYMSPMANDRGVILQNYIPGQDSSHLRLMLWRAGEGTMVYDGDFSHLMLYPVGWAGPLGSPNLLLHGYGESPTATTYSHIDVDDCDAAGCAVEALDYFPVWSPDGRRTILRKQDDNRLYLGNGRAEAEEEIGQGFAPFWLDNGRYGYVRYLVEDGFPGGDMELVTAEIGNQSSRQLLTTDDLLPLLDRSESAPAFISYVTVSPADPYRLYVSMIYFLSQQRQVEIFSVYLGEGQAGLDVEEVALELTIEGSGGGYPSLMVPNGFVPFVLSADGRWLSASRPDPETADSWIIYVHDTQSKETIQYKVGYPSSMFIHPFYDWSGDGNWLVIVDENYLRLIAPAYNYERLVTHDLQTCSHVAWVEPVE